MPSVQFAMPHRRRLPSAPEETELPTPWFETRCFPIPWFMHSSHRLSHLQGQDLLLSLERRQAIGGQE
jgi:hypothetical protein